MDPTVSIFIPAYNAAAYLPSVIDRFPPRLWRRITTVWIINDGSTDDTRAVIHSLSRKHETINPVNLRQNQGYGAAVRRGLQLC